MKLTLSTHGNTKQTQAAKLWKENPEVIDIVYGGSKGSGKSFLGCSLIFADALVYSGTHYFIARKQLTDIRKFTVPSIIEVFGILGITPKYYKYNSKDNYFQLYNGSKVYLLDAKFLPSDPLYYRFGSMQITRGWIEEAGEFEEEAKNNLAASIGRMKNEEYNLPGKLLQTCNPAKNYLYHDYYKKFKTKQLEPWKAFIQAMPSDNKKLDKGYLENLNRTLNTAQKERLLYGNWEYDDDPNTLINYEAILGLFTNIQVPAGVQKYITADVARLGADKTVIAVWQGWVVIELVEIAKSRITTVQETINALRIKHNIPAKNCVADEDGIGGGVVDNCHIKGFVNNSRALNNENYTNLKTQCYYKLAEKISEGKMYIKAPISAKQKESIIQELEQVKSKNQDSDGRLQIISKTEVKEKIGHSPDYSDALAMRMYFELAPKRFAGIRI